MELVATAVTPKTEYDLRPRRRVPRARLTVADPHTTRRRRSSKREVIESDIAAQAACRRGTRSPAPETAAEPFTRLTSGDRSAAERHLARLRSIGTKSAMRRSPAARTSATRIPAPVAVGPCDHQRSQDAARAGRAIGAPMTPIDLASTCQSRTTLILTPERAVRRLVGAARMPARSPRDTTLTATLRDASSIISSPNITAPLRSPSVVAFS